MPIYANSYNTTWKSRWRFFASSYPVPRNNQFWHHSCPVRTAPIIGTYSVTPFYFTLKRWYLWIPFYKRCLVPSKWGFLWAKCGKMDKRGATVTAGYSDYYCRGLFYANASFLVSFLQFCGFSCLLCFLRNKFTLVLQTFCWIFTM